MTSQSMTGGTQSMTANTTTFGSRSAQASRSWAAVQKITNESERRDALSRHFDQFPSVLGAASAR